MGVPVYKRILDLFEAEGVNTLFGIPDPNFVHMFAEADARGWSVVAPHHEESAGFMAEAASRMTGKPGLCIGTLGPGVANIAGAMMCAKVENSPVIFLGGQRARITERRVRRGRIQFVQQEGLFTPSVKYSCVDRIRRPDRRDRPRGDPPRDVRHAGSVLHRVPVARDPRRAGCAGTVAAQQVSPRQPGRGRARGRRGREADPRGRESDPAGRPRRAHLAHRRSRQGARRPDGLPGDPDLGRHVVHPGARGPHLPLRVLAFGGRSGGRLRPVRRARHRTRRAGPLRQDAALGEEQRHPQVGLRRAGPGGDRREPADRRAAGR